MLPEDRCLFSANQAKHKTRLNFPHAQHGLHAFALSSEWLIGIYVCHDRAKPVNALHSSEKKTKQTNKNKQKIRWKQNQLEQKFLVQNFQNFDIPILGDAGADSWGERQTKTGKIGANDGAYLGRLSSFPASSESSVLRICSFRHFHAKENKSCRTYVDFLVLFPVGLSACLFFC